MINDDPAAMRALQTISGFAEAFRTAPITMLITSVENGRFIAVNDEFTRLVGYHANEIVGRRGDEFRFWADPQQRSDVMQQVIENGSVEGIEVWFKARSGNNVVANLFASRTVFGGHECVIWYAIDITAHREAETSLHSRTKHLHAVTSALDRLPVVMIDQNGLIRSIIGGGGDKSRFPMNPKKFRGRRIAEFFDPKDADRMLEIVGEVFETGETRETQARVTGKGYEFDISVSYAPIYSRKEEVESVLAISQNITGSLQDIAALERGEAVFRSMAEEVPDLMAEGFVIVDAGDKIVWMNRAFEKFFGLRRIEVIGRDYGQLVREKLTSVVVEADEFLARALRAPADKGDVDRFRCRVRRSPSFEERWLECTSNPIEGGYYAGGRVDRCTDITRYQTAKKLLQKLNSRLVEAKRFGSEDPLLNSTAPPYQLALSDISSLVEELRALFSPSNSSRND